MNLFKPGFMSARFGPRDFRARRKAELLASQDAICLRESNRLLLLAEQLASLGHWTIDPEQELVLLSPEAATLLHMSQRSMRPAEAMQLVAADDRCRLLRALARASRQELPVECTVRLRRGVEVRTIAVRIQRTGEGAGTLFGVVSDVTEKLLAERRLMAALDEARQAAEFRSQFLATMSHEIRTPLTGVVGMIELLADEASPAKRRLYLQTLRRSADLLMSVLNDVLDFSKIDAGHITLAEEPFDLTDLCRGTAALYECAATSRDLRLLVELDAATSLWVCGDAQRLQQILGNLLANAIKFSRSGGEIRLRCEAEPAGSDRLSVRLAVEDRGVGIPADLQKRLFEPFVQGDTPLLHSGTGLGLAICRRLVGAMGGTISVSSSEDQGATFTVSLELKRAAGPAELQVANEEVQSRPLHLLLAEDNPVNQMLITALLKRLGHKVTCVGDGESALAAASRRRFHCILLDMQMPRLDGLSAANRIRSMAGPNRGTPILALTADTAAERRPRYVNSAIDGVLTKPVDSQRLRQALNAATASEPRTCGEELTPSTPGLQTLDAAVLDEVREAIGQARLDDLLLLLAAELEARPKAVRDALAGREFDRAAAEVHSLKGAAANLGAARVAEMARRVERAIKTAREGAPDDLARALRDLAEAVAETQDMLASLHRPPAAA
jgi:signal transduction histidine kinase/DNA-binding response OmpR family regulator